MAKIDIINNSTTTISRASQALGGSKGLLRGISALQSAIEGKGGKVTKLKNFPSFQELKLGIQSIPQTGGGFVDPLLITSIEIPTSAQTEYRFEKEDPDDEWGYAVSITKFTIDGLLPAETEKSKIEVSPSFPQIDPLRIERELGFSTDRYTTYISQGFDGTIPTHEHWMAMSLVVIIPNASDFSISNIFDMFNYIPLQITETGNMTTFAFISLLFPTSEEVTIPSSIQEVSTLPFPTFQTISFFRLSPEEAVNDFIYSDQPLSISVPASESSLPAYFIAGKTLQSLQVEERESSLSINQSAFREVRLFADSPDPLIFPRVRNIDEYAFRFANIYYSEQRYSKEIQFPEADFSYIPTRAFSGDSLRMEIPQSVTNIGEEAFYHFAGSLPYGGNTDLVAEKRKCSQDHTKQLQQSDMRMVYCDCNPFTTLLDSSGSIQLLHNYEGSSISQLVLLDIDTLAQEYNNFIEYYTLHTNPRTVQYLSADERPKRFIDLANDLLSKHRWLDQPYFNSQSTYLLGITHPFAAFSENNSFSQASRDELLSLLSTIFGCTTKEQFLDFAQAIVNEHLSNSAGASESNRLAYDGAIYTKSGLYILPFQAIISIPGTQELNLPIYLFLSPNGVLSALISTWETKLFDYFGVSTQHYSFGEPTIPSFELFGRCILFDEKYNKPIEQQPGLSISEGTKISYINPKSFYYSGLDNTSYGKFYVRTIPEGAFAYTRKLTKFKSMAESCSQIGEQAFMQSSIIEYEQPDASSRLTSIGSNAFANSNLHRIKSQAYTEEDKILIDVEEIGSQAFRSCKHFPKNSSGQVAPLELLNTKSVGDQAFSNTLLTDLILRYDPDSSIVAPNLSTIFNSRYPYINTVEDQPLLNVTYTQVNTNSNLLNNSLINGHLVPTFNNIKISYAGQASYITISYLIANRLELDFGDFDTNLVGLTLLNRDTQLQIHIKTLILRSQQMLNLSEVTRALSDTIKIDLVKVPASLLSLYQAQTESLTFEAIE